MGNKKADANTPDSIRSNVVNDKIYLIGGRTGGKYSTVPTNQVYDPIAESWTKKSNYDLSSYRLCLNGS